VTLLEECEPDAAATYPDPTDDAAVYAVAFEETDRLGDTRVFEQVTEYEPTEPFIRAVCHVEGRPREQIRFEVKSITADDPLDHTDALLKTEDERD
jgi:hypothetical protein